ncbi:MAG: hypothetical protein Q8M58_15230 [Anaerolineales bacterium]|nr:hypothetical protein [Anaerolineales bacterium]
MDEFSATPPPPRKSNTGLIIAIVVLCCCCVGAIGLTIAFGQDILRELGIYISAPALATLI